MKTSVLEISNGASEVMKGLNSTLTFKRFIEYIEKRVSDGTTARKGYFEFVYEKLTADPAFTGAISLEDIPKYQEQFDLIYSIMIPPVADEEQVLWGLSTALDPVLFYGTSAFYKLLTIEETGLLNCNIIREEEQQVNVRQKMQVLYSLILNRLYGFNFNFQNQMILSLADEKSGLPKYYRVNLDTSFIDVFPSEDLQDLKLDTFDLKDGADWSELSRILPLSKLRFEGFSIITLTDITSDYTVEQIKNVILDHGKDNSGDYFMHIAQSLKTLVANKDVEFGLLPLLRVNSRFVFNHESYTYSMVMKYAMENGLGTEEFEQMTEAYFQNPKVFILNDLGRSDLPQEHFTQLLVATGIKSYGLLPVYYNNHIAGVLEVYSHTLQFLDETILSKLDVALPLVAQVLQNSIDDFHGRIDNIIKDKFTSIQPSVQWKFKEVAWNYLRDNAQQPQNTEIERIQFKNVFPLYGAIDIRNSTIERNKALSDDLIVQFNALISTIKSIKKEYRLGLLDEMIYKCEKWISKIGDHSIDHEEMKVKDFFESEVVPLLQHFRSSCPELTDTLNRYDAVVDEETGAAYANRRALESSMQKINSGLNMYLDLFKNQIQESYPCYFEKFRTDGVEYDIYIGQSIAPQKKFNHLYLKNIRLWQLTSMAAIAKITHSLLPDMEKPLETTQLIFINHGSIDISFRDDERRFDVEGAYNIRYHVIKKRIDKVRVAHTDERLTQPGKIAMVYFNSKEADEYVEYVRYLQEQGMLTDDLEHLELEELQGVTGLKALRVGINLDGVWKQSLEIALLEKLTEPAL